MRRKPILRSQGQSRGLGLFSHIKNDTTTPFQDTVGIVCGSVFFVVALELAFMTLAAQRSEQLRFGRAQSHIGGFLCAGAFFVVAIFFAHAGVIYWVQRLIGGKEHRSRGNES